VRSDLSLDHAEAADLLVQDGRLVRSPVAELTCMHAAAKKISQHRLRLPASFLSRAGVTVEEQPLCGSASASRPHIGRLGSDDAGLVPPKRISRQALTNARGM
jgi:hypothetical protein